MAFVYKRGNIYYVGYHKTVIGKDGKPKRIQLAYPVSPDKTVAREKAAKKTLLEYAERNKLLKSNVTMAEFYEDYKIHYSVKKKRQKTIHRDDLIFSMFRRVCPETMIVEQFDDSALNNYIARRKQEGNVRTRRMLKMASINREVGMLKNLMRWGYKNRYLASNYYDLIDKEPETDSQPKKPFPDEYIQLIIDNTVYPQREAHILSIWHGMRANEIVPIECTDFVWIAPGKSYIKIRNKPHLNEFVKTKLSERDIPIHPFWHEHLYNIWLKAKEISNFFLLTREHKRLTTTGLSSYTRKLFKKLNFPPKEYTFHCGRHTFATRIKDGGGTLTIASKSLGHSNTRTTEDFYTDYKPHEHFSVIDHIKIDIKKPAGL